MSRTAQQWETPPALPLRDYVSSRVYTAAEHLDEEQNLLKRRTWKFACHVSEIPNAYDYRTIDHAGVPLVIVRGEDGNVHSYVNSCSHRSAPILRDARGNA